MRDTPTGRLRRTCPEHRGNEQRGSVPVFRRTVPVLPNHENQAVNACFSWWLEYVGLQLAAAQAGLGGSMSDSGVRSLA